MTLEPDTAPIGGYLSLEPASGAGMAMFDDAGAYQSARSAMCALLKSTAARTVWAPYFVCGAVDDVFALLGLQVHRYSLAPTLGVPDDLPLASADWLICVDYFGLTADACDAAISTYGSDRVLVDASQALFHRPRRGVSTVYSPRKFVGIPDGGLLVTPREIATPHAADEDASIARSHHLLSRAIGDVERGYVEFQQAEASLKDCTPRAMSGHTSICLRSIDFENVRDSRVRNYRYLASRLGGLGYTVPELPANAIPLCCPVFGVDAPNLRHALALRRIFTPAYWPDAKVPPDDHVGSALQDGTIYLPCDQRHGQAEMERIIDAMIQIGEAA